MQLLNAECPYCGQDVETTADQLDKPVICSSCEKPFEVEMPCVEVNSVREVDDVKANLATSSTHPAERTLIKVHPVVIRRHLLGTLILLMIIAASGFGLWWSLVRADNDAWSQFASWLSVAGLVGVLFALGWWYLTSIATTLTITDNRTILREGLIQKKTSEVQHDDVRNLQVKQSFFQRLLGIGEVGISSSGQDDLEIVVQHVPDPGGIAEVIRRHQV